MIGQARGIERNGETGRLFNEAGEDAARCEICYSVVSTVRASMRQGKIRTALTSAVRICIRAKGLFLPSFAIRKAGHVLIRDIFGRHDTLVLWSGHWLCPRFISIDHVAEPAFLV